ncbi:hypothetical protein M8494_12950 [Serratia ureilytica]
MRITISRRSPVAFAQGVQPAGVIDGGVEIVDGVGADHHQQAAVFTGEDFSQCVFVTRSRCRRRPPRSAACPPTLAA